MKILEPTKMISGYNEAIVTNKTLYISMAGDDDTGDGTSGNPWETPRRALEYLANLWISSKATVVIELADGHYSGFDTVEAEHPCGAQILITGANTHTKSMTSVESSAGSAGNWLVVLNLDSVADIVPDDLVNISGAANGTKPTFISGCWPVTNVDVGNSRITIASTHNHATAPSGAVAADVVVLKSVLDFGANTGFYAENGRIINLADLCICTTGRGLHAEGAGLIFANGVNIGAASNAARAQTEGKIILQNCAFSNCSSDAIYAATSGFVSGVNSIVSGGAANGFYAVNLSRMRIVTGISTGNTGKGVEAGTGSSIIIFSGISTGNDYGFFASGKSYIGAVGNTVSDNTTADFSPAENTEGNEMSLIDT